MKGATFALEDPVHLGTSVTIVKELLCEPLHYGDLTVRHDQCVSLGGGPRTTPPFFRTTPSSPYNKVFIEYDETSYGSVVDKITI